MSKCFLSSSSPGPGTVPWEPVPCPLPPGEEHLPNPHLTLPWQLYAVPSGPVTVTRTKKSCPNLLPGPLGLTCTWLLKCGLVTVWNDSEENHGAAPTCPREHESCMRAQTPARCKSTGSEWSKKNLLRPSSRAHLSLASGHYPLQWAWVAWFASSPDNLHSFSVSTCKIKPKSSFPKA